MEILMTGATGFIGSRVLRNLLADGHAVRVLALPDTVEAVPRHPRVTIVAGGLDQPRLLAEAASGVESVYHLAALVIGASAQDLVRVNVDGTENLLDAITNAKVSRVVFTSSVAVYDSTPDPSLWPISEDAPRRAHGNDALRTYGQSKIDGERAILRSRRQFGLSYTIVRPPAVYGLEAAWMHDFVRRLARNPQWTLSPRARSFRMQWMHVDDLARGIVLAGTSPAGADEVFNLAGGELFTPYDLLTTSRRSIAAWTLAPEAFDPVAHTTERFGLKYDIGKARRLLGFEPRVKLADGLPGVDTARTLRQAEARPLAPWFARRRGAPIAR